MNMGKIEDDNLEENKNEINKGKQLKEELMKNTNLFDINNLMKTYKEGEGRGNQTDFKFNEFLKSSNKQNQNNQFIQNNNNTFAFNQNNFPMKITPNQQLYNNFNN